MTSDSDPAAGDDDGFVYRFTAEVAVRFRDLDAMGHVNNAVYLTYVETALARYYETVLEERLSDVSTAMVSLDMEFHRAITEGDRVTVAMCVHDIGETSLQMAYEIRVDAAVAATARTVQVVLDPDSNQPRPVPDSWRDRIACYEAVSPGEN